MKWLDVEFEGVIFDFDGTLVDSMPDWSGKMLHLLDSHKVAYPADIIRTLTPLGDVGSIKYFIENLGLEMSAAEIQKELDEYALPRYRDTILPKAGILSLLEKLAAAEVPLCILTASPEKMVSPCLIRNRMDHYFTFSWSSNDLGMSKSDPKIYAKTCEALGTDPRKTLFVDDNLYALRAAKSAGLLTCGIFDESSALDVGEIRGTTDIYLEHWEMPL